MSQQKQDGRNYAAESTKISLPANNAAKGLIYNGLEISSDCPGGLYKISGFTDSSGKSICTHGPDPAPKGVDITKNAFDLIVPENSSLITVPCDGDGVSGNRVEAIYVRADNAPDNYKKYLTRLQQLVAGVDYTFNVSAQETGGVRHGRFVHDSQCVPIIRNEVLSPAGISTFRNTISELKNRGYNNRGRRYMIFADANIYCGIGSIYNDDRHDSTNWNNVGGPLFGRTDAGCWGYAEAHELMHNLGAVQLSAPHTSGGWHCVDEYDEMCYSDYPYYPPMQYSCPQNSHDRLFDCKHDDYYSTNPGSDSYLATHWNAANSWYLMTAGAPVPSPTLPSSGCFNYTGPATVETNKYIRYSISLNGKTLTQYASSGACYEATAGTGDPAGCTATGENCCFVGQTGNQCGGHTATRSYSGTCTISATLSDGTSCSLSVQVQKPNISPTPTSIPSPSPWIQVKVQNKQGQAVVVTKISRANCTFSPCTQSMGEVNISSARFPGGGANFGGRITSSGYIVIGVTPVPNTGKLYSKCQGAESQSSCYVWPSWKTGRNSVIFVVATPTPKP